MHHIGSIEPIITQLVLHDFIGGETTNSETVKRQQQRGLTKLILMQTVLEVTTWRNRENNMLALQLRQSEQPTPNLHHLIHLQAAPRKGRSRKFVTIGYHLTLILINPYRAKGQQQHRFILQCLPSGQNTLPNCGFKLPAVG